MIIVVDGGLGAGKTYTAVSLALDALRAGTPVAANFHIVGAAFLSSWPEFMSFRDGVLVWDEAHLDIDSREFAHNVSITPWLTQLRKLGVHLVVISQNIDQVDKRLRRLSDRLIRCERVQGVDYAASRLLVIDLFSARILRDVIVRHDVRVYASYNTRELVRPLVGKPLPLGALDVLQG